MKEEKLSEEKKLIEEKLRLLKSRMVQDVERGELFELSERVRLLQQSYQLLKRI